ncbi:tRNA synthetases class II (A)-domain-containing protein [Mycena capillaripes]|nr:tRNA synthetases class II (A)-domain-containing protein [Mycena capillaripes]
MVDAQLWTSDRIRDEFFNYFKSKNHTFVPSSSTLPLNDPSLLFTNAGMNQFKPIFLGTVDPHSEKATLKRAFNSQKCVRAGGKHNDLDIIGKSSYHHTFFEMLGNWSFGDYFKKESIAQSWEVLTTVYKLPRDQIYATYFEGDPTNGLEPDLEAKQYWLDQGMAEDHIVPGNAKDNFWEMGKTGPCGPSSEIFFDCVGGRNASHLVNQDDPDNVIEIWNNVFMQFNREGDGSLRTLPSKHIDTGLGFERLVYILQNKRSTYDTDLFLPILTRIQELTGMRPYQGRFGSNDTDGIDTAYRIVADHVRSLTFILSDGGIPGSVGSGYVVRHILRRGALTARNKLGVKIGSFFSSLMAVVIETLVCVAPSFWTFLIHTTKGHVYPEITQRTKEIEEILNREEHAFAQVLEKGEKLFQHVASRAVQQGATEISGEDVWRLYDTFGFPPDLTRFMAEQIGLGVNEEQFQIAQSRSKDKSTVSTTGLSVGVTLTVHDIACLRGDSKLEATDDISKFDKPIITATLKIIICDGRFVQSTSDIPSGTSFGIILDRTNLFAESGGQIYDTGRIYIDQQREFEVEKVHSYGGYTLHVGSIRKGTLNVGDTVTTSLDLNRRSAIRSNHTATHILNLILRDVLTHHSDQKGSLVAPQRLRFDFQHDGPLTLPQLSDIETESRRLITQDMQVFSAVVELEKALKIPGVRAVFGEGYPDPVRVVSVGRSVDDIFADIENPEWRKISVELCGGTHVPNTGQIENFIITEESGTAKGIRRITAVTGSEARAATGVALELDARLSQLEASATVNLAELKTLTQEVTQAIISVIQKSDFKQRLTVLRKATQKSFKDNQIEYLKTGVSNIQKYFEENPNSEAYIAILDVNENPKALREVISRAENLDKALYLFSVDESGTKVVHANWIPSRLRNSSLGGKKWMEGVTAVIGGTNWGDDESAQGVGLYPGNIATAIDVAKRYIFKSD